MKNILKQKATVFLGALFAFVTPFAVFAQQTTGDNCASGNTGNEEGTIGYIICKIAFFISSLIPILISLAVVYFIYGVIMYVIASEEEAKKKGRNSMIYGLIGLLVIVSIWGLVKIVKDTFGVKNSKLIQVPCIASPGVTCPP